MAYNNLKNVTILTGDACIDDSMDETISLIMKRDGIRLDKRYKQISRSKSKKQQLKEKRGEAYYGK